MRTLLHVLGHVTAVGLQLANIALPVLGPEGKAVAAAAIALGQGVAAAKVAWCPRCRAATTNRVML